MAALANRLGDALTRRAMPELLIVAGVIVLAAASSAFLSVAGA